jgi:hypothetical protein
MSGSISLLSNTPSWRGAYLSTGTLPLPFRSQNDYILRSGTGRSLLTCKQPEDFNHKASETTDNRFELSKTLSTYEVNQEYAQYFDGNDTLEGDHFESSSSKRKH